MKNLLERRDGNRVKSVFDIRGNEPGGQNEPPCIQTHKAR